MSHFTQPIAGCLVSYAMPQCSWAGAVGAGMVSMSGVSAVCQLLPDGKLTGRGLFCHAFQLLDLQVHVSGTWGLKWRRVSYYLLRNWIEYALIQVKRCRP